MYYNTHIQKNMNVLNNFLETWKHFKQIAMYNDPSIISMLAVVVAAELWCLSPIASQILFTTLGRNGSVLDRSHRSAPPPTDCRLRCATTQRLYHRLLIVEFQSHVLLSVKKYQAPPNQPTQAGTPLAYTQEMSQDFLHKNI